MGPLTSDASWVRQAFIVEQSSLESVDQINRFWSKANIKFTDTSLGGNFAINPPAQWNSFTDPRPPHKSRGTNSVGLGRAYSELIDDNSQLIHIRCGLPDYNSMSNFFGNFYNYEAGQLARTGRAPSWFYTIGRAAGFVASILSWKIMAVHMVGLGTALLSQKPNSKFYYSKPAMPLYWNAVQTMVNQIAVNMGIVPRIGGNDAQTLLNNKFEFTDADKEALHNAFPELFNSAGSIDVYAAANRAQRMARQQERAYEQAFGDSDNADLTQNILKIYSSQVSDGGYDYNTYLQQWLGTGMAQIKGDPNSSAGAAGNSSVPSTGGQSAMSSLAAAGAALAAATDGVQSTSTGTTNGTTNAPAAPSPSDSSSESLMDLLDPAKQDTSFYDFLKAEWNDGSAFATFRVDATGPVSESFTSNIAESEISNKLNGLSSSGREMQFTFANGNIVGGVLGDVAGAVIGSVKDLVFGGLDQLKLSGLAALTGSAFVDIPKHWTGSTARLPQSSYTVQLRSPYGNQFSRLMNLYVPLSMLLAMALPLSTGKQSYTSPFLVELYDKGRCITRLGMVDSMQVTRGVGNTGWNNSGEALGIDVTFTIVDMSSVMHMPISAGFNSSTLFNVVGDTTTAAVGGALVAGPAGAAVAGGLAAANALGVFDEDTVFTDYMNTLASISLADSIYPLRRFRRNLTQKLTAFKSWASTSHMASFAGDVLPSRVISAIVKGTVR